MSAVKEMFTKNWGLKLIALFLAVVLEIYFYSPDNSVSAVVRVRVEVLGLPTNYVITEPHDRNGVYSVAVHVLGPRTLIDQVRTANYRFRVTAPAGSMQQFSASLDERQLSLPSGVEVQRIVPDRITVKAEREVKKELLVVLDKVGNPPEGYRIEGIHLFPQSVVVRGPLSRMEGLQAVETVAVDVDGLKTPIESEISLKDLGELVVPSVTMVRAKIVISEIPQEKSLELVPVRVVAAQGFAASVETAKARVVLAGPMKALEGLTAESVTLKADARKLKPGTHEVALTAELPTGVSILSTEPSTVRVRLTASQPENPAIETQTKVEE